MDGHYCIESLTVYYASGSSWTHTFGLAHGIEFSFASLILGVFLQFLYFFSHFGRGGIFNEGLVVDISIANLLFFFALGYFASKIHRENLPVPIQLGMGEIAVSK